MNRVVVEQIDLEDVRPGGIETCIVDMLTWSSSTRFHVFGITSDLYRQLGAPTEVSFGGRTHLFTPVARLNPNRTRRLIPNSVRLALGLARYRRCVPAADFVQVHRIEFGLVARLLLRGHPLVQFIHTDGLAQTSRKSESLWRRLAPLYRLLESRVLPHARQVVIFNRPDGERLRAKLGHVLLKRTWFDPSVYRPGESFTVDECPAPDAALQLLWVGRFEEQKNPVLAVQTLAALRKMGIPATLTMVGSGTKKAEILANATQLQVHDHLDLTGALARKDVADRMRRADLLLMTSYFEGSPRVLIEANACGLPAAVTPGSDPDVAVVKQVNGARSLDDQPASMIDAVTRAIHTPKASCIRAVQHLRADTAVAELLGE